MVSSGGRWAAGIALVQGGLLAATYPLDALGTETWHHLASLAAVLVITYALRERFRASRRFLAVGVLASSVLAIVSGFYLLYWKAGIRVDGYQDWAVFWHIAWSWFAAVFIFHHTWINRVQFGHFFRESFTRPSTAAVHLLGYTAVIAAVAITWSPGGRVLFTNENYVPFSLRTWAVVGAPAYVGWLLLRWRRGDGPPARTGSWTIRRAADLALVPTAALAVLSGFPLLFDGPIDPRGLKYVAKYWHVAPSIVFTVLVTVHGAQAWGTLKAHWKSYDR